jgi:leader peptidase (prepilin peptidase)/N-methyltransferase
VTALLVVGCAVVGLFVGSFLNVVIERVPERKSIVRPRSRCPHCETQIEERDLIPIFSWFRLGGRCRHCGHAISVQYPLVEAGNAVLWVIAAVRFGTSTVLVPFLLLFSMLLAVSVVDLRLYRIPDRIVFPTLAVSLPLIVLVSLQKDVPSAITYALVGAVTYFVLLFIPHLIYPAGMGFGDVKLALVMGLYIGWLAASVFSSIVLCFYALIAGSLLGTIGGLAVMAVRHRRDAFPFGPALALSTVIIVVFSRSLVDFITR